MNPFPARSGVRLDVVMYGQPERRPSLVGQYVGFDLGTHLETRRIHSTKWAAGRRPEVSFGPGEPYHPASKIVIHRNWAPLPRDSVRRFLESLGVAPAEATAAAVAARKLGDPAARDLADVATAADIPTGPAAPAPKLDIPECATCDHPAVRAFVELAMGVESGAPAYHSIEMAQRLAFFGYRVELIQPHEDAPEPRGDWCWLMRGGRVVSGLPLGTVGMTGTENPAPPASPESARHDGAVNAKGAGPGKVQPPSLCGPDVALTTRGPGNPQTDL